jgi:hypothetical protein
MSSDKKKLKNLEAVIRKNKKKLKDLRASLKKKKGIDFFAAAIKSNSTASIGDWKRAFRWVEENLKSHEEFVNLLLKPRSRKGQVTFQYLYYDREYWTKGYIEKDWKDLRFNVLPIDSAATIEELQIILPQKNKRTEKRLDSLRKKHDRDLENSNVVEANLVYGTLEEAEDENKRDIEQAYLRNFGLTLARAVGFKDVYSW